MRLVYACLTLSAKDNTTEQLRARINLALEACLLNRPETEVLRASRYLLLAGGSRWRGLFAMAAGRRFTPEAEPLVLPFACALEAFHAASLILDDFPSMDNAKTRRGQPCMHLVFPAWAVDMTPAFLVNMAYHLNADNPGVPAERRIQAMLVLGTMGANLARGQELDLTLTPATLTESGLLDCYALKSGALFAAALSGGALLCGARPAEVEALHTAGIKLGQAYQILDDIADGTSPAGKGEEAAPCTAVSLFGDEAAGRRADLLFGEVTQLIHPLGPDADPLRSLIHQVREQAPH